MVNIEAKNTSLLSKHEMEAVTLGKFKSNKMLELAIYNSHESKLRMANQWFGEA